MAIDINALKPILEPLIEGREDAVEILQAVTDIDVEIEASGFNQSDIDAAFNRGKIEAFFRPSAGEAPAVVTTTVDDINDVPDPETITFEDLFESDDTKEH